MRLLNVAKRGKVTYVAMYEEDHGNIGHKTARVRPSGHKALQQVVHLSVAGLLCLPTFASAKTKKVKVGRAIDASIWMHGRPVDIVTAICTSPSCIASANALS